MTEKKTDKKRNRKSSNDSGYKNPKGNLTEEEFNELKKKSFDELKDYLSKFKLIDNKCPPEKWCVCVQFRCTRCYARAFGKEFYNYLFKEFDDDYNKKRESKIDKNIKKVDEIKE